MSHVVFITNVHRRTDVRVLPTIIKKNGERTVQNCRIGKRKGEHAKVVKPNGIGIPVSSQSLVESRDLACARRPEQIQDITPPLLNSGNTKKGNHIYDRAVKKYTNVWNGRESFERMKE